MKILVTGGSGFIGSNFIINRLINSENKILNVDCLTYAGNPQNLKSIDKSKNYSFLNINICDSKNILNAILNFKPDSIVHFAAESHVDRSIDGPIKFIDTNIVGTARLLEASYKYWSNYNKKFS